MLRQTIHTLITSLGTIKDPNGPATYTQSAAGDFGDLRELTKDAKNAFVALSYLLPGVFHVSLGLLDEAEIRKSKEGRYEVISDGKFALVDLQMWYCSCQEFALSCFGQKNENVDLGVEGDSEFGRSQPFSACGGNSGLCSHILAAYLRKYSGLMKDD